MLHTNLTKFRTLLIIPLFFALGCETGTNDEVELSDKPFGAVSPDQPIQEIIAQTFVLQNVEAMLVATGVAGEMQSPPYTVFTPWDYALKRLPYWNKITRNRAWYGHLRDLALGHIHEGNIPPELIEGDMAVTMLNGDTATVSKENSRVRVDGERVIGDTAASDGYLYMLDEVREPKWTKRTVLDIIDSDERFSILAQILNHPSMGAKREELASSTAELTFFAPTNEALAGFDIEQCEEPECSEMLKQIVENHLVGALVPRMFTPTKSFATQAGSSLDWNSGTQSVTCTDADETLQEADELSGDGEEYALNGIVQPMNALLCTKIPRCTAECAPDQQCGAIDDGCGGTIECGICGSGQVCENHMCVDTDPDYQCDIVCTGGKILSDDCEPSMLVPGESLCEMKRDSCCVEDTSSCPTLCDEDEIFDGDAYIHVEEMTCRDYLADLAPADFDCVDPYPHVPDTCCKGVYQSSPPKDPSPCYNLCGDNLQMVGSRLIDGFDLTCFDYASSLNEQSEECTAPSAGIISRCCDDPQPIPTGNTGNYCTLCGSYSGPPGERLYHSIGPDNLTCIGLDSDMIFDLKKSDAECTAKKEAFFATCCDLNYTPPEPVPQSSMDNIPSNPCAQPDAPKDWCDGGDYPKCDLCKDGSYPKNPFTITAIAYIPGNPTCNDLYWMGLYNHLPGAMCYPIQNFMEEPCGCK